MVNYKLLLLFLTSVLASCDPGMSGDLKIYNDSGQILTVKYDNGSKDTAIVNIGPGSNLLVTKIGGMGDNRDIKCCPDRVWIYSVTSPAGAIKKDPTKCDNWDIPNKQKLRRFSGPGIKCELHVTAADL